METMLAPAQGATVYYKLGSEWNHADELRPAIVVRVWSATTVNLLIFVDGDNDKFIGPDGWESVSGHLLWKTSVVYEEYAEGGLNNRWSYGEAILEPYEA